MRDPHTHEPAAAQALQAAIGHTFETPALLQEALTHASLCSEGVGQRNNERLEFLGDAVLELLITAHLYQRYPDYDEGRLTRMRSGLVSEPALAAVARDLALGDYLRMGRGAEQGNGRNNPSILSDALEALIGALYIDAGLDCARAFILPRLDTRIRAAAKAGYTQDYKTRLQEQLQTRGAVRIEYVCVDEQGPAHARTFQVHLLADDVFLAEGQGSSKKDAQQQAARAALAQMRSDQSEQG